MNIDVPVHKQLYSVYNSSEAQHRATREFVPDTQHRATREFVPMEKKDDKYWFKRVRNNVSARKSRMKRKAIDKVMDRKLLCLQRENLKLHSDLAALNVMYLRYSQQSFLVSCFPKIKNEDMIYASEAKHNILGDESSILDCNITPQNIDNNKQGDFETFDTFGSADLRGSKTSGTTSSFSVSIGNKISGNNNVRGSKTLGSKTSGSIGPRGGKTSDSMGPHSGKTSDSMGPRGSKTSGSMGPRGSKTSDSMGPRDGKTSETMGPHGSKTSGSMGSRGSKTSDSINPHGSKTSGRMGPRGSRFSGAETIIKVKISRSDDGNDSSSVSSGRSEMDDFRGDCFFPIIDKSHGWSSNQDQGDIDLFPFHQFSATEECSNHLHVGYLSLPLNHKAVIADVESVPYLGEAIIRDKNDGSKICVPHKIRIKGKIHSAFTNKN